MPLPVLIYERKTNDYEPGRMRNMNIHQINAARCANYGLEFILFLLLTCYQQPQYELEKVVARPHEGFFVSVASFPLLSQSGKNHAEELGQPEKDNGCRENHTYSEG
jgi:hypothetical protein